MDTVIGILVMAGLIGGGIWLINRNANKRKADTWTGTILKKWISSYSDDDGNVSKTPMIQVQKSDGKKKKYAVSNDTYNSLSQGDKVKKEPGQMDPVKA